MIHITIAGIGKFGMEVCKDFHARFMECYEYIEKSALKVIVNQNELSAICNIEISHLIGENTDKLIPWNNQEIEAEERTRDILITVGEATDLSFKMFHASAVGLLGKPESLRLAFIKTDNAAVENVLLNQQLDQIIACEDKRSAVGMLMQLIRLCYIQNFDMSTLEQNEFRILFGSCFGQVIMSYKERLALRYAYGDSENLTYEGDICKLVETVTKTIVNQSDTNKKYVAFICVEGLWSLDLLGLIMECFRKNVGAIQVIDEKLLFTKTIEYDSKIRNACMIFLMETNNVG